MDVWTWYLCPTQADDSTSCPCLTFTIFSLKKPHNSFHILSIIYFWIESSLLSNINDECLGENCFHRGWGNVKFLLMACHKLMATLFSLIKLHRWPGRRKIKQLLSILVSSRLDSLNSDGNWLHQSLVGVVQARALMLQKLEMLGSGLSVSHITLCGLLLGNIALLTTKNISFQLLH